MTCLNPTLHDPTLYGFVLWGELVEAACADPVFPTWPRSATDHGALPIAAEWVLIVINVNVSFNEKFSLLHDGPYRATCNISMH